jgi:hypothetical protein
MKHLDEVVELSHVFSSIKNNFKGLLVNDDGPKVTLGVLMKDTAKLEEYLLAHLALKFLCSGARTRRLHQSSEGCWQIIHRPTVQGMRCP